jgi:multicomponent Na+:H+ antiporter subunit B
VNDDTTVIARTVTRIVVPIILVTAVALLLQGHQLPGGGFIAGVLTTTAVGLIYVIFGLDYLEEEVLHRQPSVEELPPPIVADYRSAYALGLAVALVSGLVAIAVGAPFLDQGFVYIKHLPGSEAPLPLYDEIELASTIAFDVGVYLVVVGALLTILGVVGAE